MGLADNKTSSAYKLILCIIFPIDMPFIFKFWQIMAAKGSIKMANSKGAKAHPCLVPLYNEKLCDKIPLVMTEALGSL